MAAPLILARLGGLVPRLWGKSRVITAGAARNVTPLLTRAGVFARNAGRTILDAWKSQPTLGKMVIVATAAAHVALPHVVVRFLNRDDVVCEAYYDLSQDHVQAALDWFESMINRDPPYVLDDEEHDIRLWAAYLDEIAQSINITDTQLFNTLRQYINTLSERIVVGRDTVGESDTDDGIDQHPLPGVDLVRLGAQTSMASLSALPGAGLNPRSFTGDVPQNVKNLQRFSPLDLSSALSATLQEHKGQIGYEEGLLLLNGVYATLSQWLTGQAAQVSRVTNTHSPASTTPRDIFFGNFF
jgi:hypothetical protein